MIKLNEVTWYSKLAAVIFFIGIFPMWAFYMGMIYQQAVTIAQIPLSTSMTPVRIVKPITITNPQNNSSIGPIINELGIGQSTTINGLTITLEKIIQDSRCSLDVQCIRAGNVTTQVTLKDDLKTSAVEIKSDASYIFDAYTIDIQKVNPSKTSTVQIDPQDYKIVFKVQR